MFLIKLLWIYIKSEINTQVINNNKLNRFPEIIHLVFMKNVSKFLLLLSPWILEWAFKDPSYYSCVLIVIKVL